jgi:hypothetical protein
VKKVIKANLGIIQLMKATYPVKFKKSVMSEAKALSSVVRLWKFTAGHTGGRGFMDDFLKNGRIALGYVYKKGLEYVEHYNDLSKLRDWRGRSLSDNVKRQMWDFLSMDARDVVALKLRNQVVALGIVTTGRLLRFDDTPLESQFFKSEQNYPNRKEVSWLSKFSPQKIDDKRLIRSFRYPQDTIHEITESYSKIRILAWLIFYRNNFATPKERKLIKHVGRIGSTKQAFPRRIQTTLEIAEREYSAMDKVIRYEEEVEKRKVTLVHNISIGYDLESKSDKDVRYIEVKSRLGGFPVTLTETELKAARMHKDQYFLYVVISDNEMLRVQNPSRLRKRQLMHIVWELENWASVAKHIKLD